MSLRTSVPQIIVAEAEGRSVLVPADGAAVLLAPMMEPSGIVIPGDIEAPAGTAGCGEEFVAALDVAQPANSAAPARTSPAVRVRFIISFLFWLGLSAV